MSKEEAEKFLRQSSEYVNFGIYAVQKGDKIDMLNIKCKSVTQLKRRIREFKAKGFKVHSNGLRY